MQILTFLRAKIFKSSCAALELAKKNPKYCELAKNIVSVKQSNAVNEAIVSRSKERRYIQANFKVNKYKYILNMLSSIENKSQKTTDFTSFDDFCGLPRLKVSRVNGNDHEYFSPHNNQGSKFIVTRRDEQAI